MCLFPNLSKYNLLWVTNLFRIGNPSLKIKEKYIILVNLLKFHKKIKKEIVYYQQNSL